MCSTRPRRSGRGHGVRQDGNRGRLGQPVGAPALQAADAGGLQMLRERADARTLGHDRPQARVVRGRLEQQLAADRQAEAGDPSALDVGTAREEVQRRDAGRPRRSSRIGSARPRSLPSPRRSSVSTPYPCVCQQSRMSKRRGRTTGEDDHGRAVARRRVRGGERQAVGGAQRHVLPERRGDGRARLVGGDDRQADRQHDEERGERGGDGEREPPCPRAPSRRRERHRAPTPPMTSATPDERRPAITVASSPESRSTRRAAVRRTRRRPPRGRRTRSRRSPARRAAAAGTPMPARPPRRAGRAR